MDGYLRAYRTDDATADADGTMSFVASTAGVKRDGLKIDQKRWRLDNYNSNPVVLWAHDYSSLPIGRAEVLPGDEALTARVAFDLEDPRAAEVYGKYQRGMLNAVSVGWRDVKEGDGIWHELLDISAVRVPGDPQALAQRTRDALASLLEELDDVDNDSDGWPSWQDTATEMADVFLAWGETPEPSRYRRYKTLLPVYKHHGKTAPEWVTDAELRCLDVEAIERLFLEGELDAMDEHTRAGAVLNARNKADLSEAQRLIQRVLDSAKANEAGDEEPAESKEKQDEEPKRTADVVSLRTMLEVLS